jgi:hypothetical protein
VLALIHGGRGVEDWTAAAAEPSILRHGWGGRNGDFLVDGSVEARPAPGSLSRVQKVAVGKLGKFKLKLKYQGKHVILGCLNLYCSGVATAFFNHSAIIRPLRANSAS